MSKIFLILSMICLLRGVETSNFEIKGQSYPGGMFLYVKWDSDAHTLHYSKLTNNNIFKLDESKIDSNKFAINDISLLFDINRIYNLLIKLPNQRDLKSDGISVFDGVGYQFIINQNLINREIYYANPESHMRIMDMACVGIIKIVEDLANDHSHIIVVK